MSKVAIGIQSTVHPINKPLSFGDWIKAIKKETGITISGAFIYNPNKIR